jgi:hypothetical protein
VQSSGKVRTAAISACQHAVVGVWFLDSNPPRWLRLAVMGPGFFLMAYGTRWFSWPWVNLWIGAVAVSTLAVLYVLDWFRIRRAESLAHHC